MGTPEFAAASLQHLVESRMNVVGVVTAPDRPSGRGQKTKLSAVKKTATELIIPVQQPPKLKDIRFLNQLQAWQPDLIIVVAFRMLPKEVWDMPALGTINLHASLLPQYRGAAPLNWALINGESETGITTFFINEKIDTGHILLQEKVAIGTHTTVGELHDLLMERGAHLIEQTIMGLEENSLVATPQLLEPGDLDLKTAPKLSKKTGQIDWTQDAQQVHNLIRGLSPYPGAWSVFSLESGQKLKAKLLASDLDETRTDLAPGEIEQTSNRVWIGTARGVIRLDEIQPEGKRRMLVSDFLKGFRDRFNSAVSVV